MKKGSKIINRKKPHHNTMRRHKEVFLKNEEDNHKVWHRRKVIYCHNPACKKRLSFYNPNLYCFVCAPRWIEPELRPYSTPIKRKYGGYVKRWCKFPRCGKKYYAKGYCVNCYSREIINKHKIRRIRGSY